MGDEYDNIVAFRDEGLGEDWAECRGDGQIDHFMPMTGVLERSEECVKEPRDCSSCPLYKEQHEHKS